MADKPNNIHNLPNATAESVSRLELAEPELASTMAIVSRMRFNSYESHIKAGFTPAQALVLCVNLNVLGV